VKKREWGSMRWTVPWYASAVPYMALPSIDGLPGRRPLARICTLNAAIVFLMNGQFGPIENLLVELDDGSAQWCGKDLEVLFKDPSRPAPLDQAKPI
jgi:hypothetical protein